MAAVAYPVARGPAGSRPRLVVVAGGPARRPSAGSRRGAAMYRRRRAVALALLAVGAVVAGLALRAALAGLGGGPVTTAAPSSIGIPPPATPHVHVVQPGETLWSIVVRTGGSGDPRGSISPLRRPQCFGLG